MNKYSKNSVIYDLLTIVERFIFCVLIKSTALHGSFAYLFYMTYTISKTESKLLYDNIFSKNCDKTKDIRFGSYRKIKDVSREVYFRQ